jgi:hypothetical protein
LKPAAGATGARVVATQFLDQLLVATDDAEAALDACFCREALAAFASRLLKNSLLSEPGMARGADQSLQVIDLTGASPDMRRTRDLRNAQDVRFSTIC